MEIKSGKIVKNLDFFSASYKNSAKFFFVLVKSYSISPVCLQHIMNKSFVPASFKVSIDHWPI